MNELKLSDVLRENQELKDRVKELESYIDAHNAKVLSEPPEQDFFFEVNGVKLRLNVQKHGFTLWDDIGKQWILDASTIANSLAFNVGNDHILTDVSVSKINTIFGAEFEISRRQP